MLKIFTRKYILQKLPFGVRGITPLWCLGILLLFFTSCSKNDDGNVNTITQTVVVFFPWAENLTTESGFLSSDISEIKTAIKNAKNMDGYRVLVYRGNTATTAQLFEFVIGTDKTIKENKLQDYTNIDQTSETDLTNIFSYIKSQTNTPTYKMIVGGHGCGWLPSEVTYGSIKAPMKSFGGSSTKNIRIDISTFSNALSNSGITPDVIIFDACCMGNIETLWSLRSSAKYIIAPPAEQAGYGFPYNTIWSDIISNTSLDNMKSICDKYKQYYDNNHSGYQTTSGSSVSPANMTVIDCQGLPLLAETMREINSDSVASENIQNILTGTKSISSVQRYDMKQSGVFYDIQSYADAILQPESYLYGATLYSNLQTALQSTVKYFTNAGYYLAKSKYCYPLSTENTCGLATSDPSVNTYVTPYKEQTDWWKATH